MEQISRIFEHYDILFHVELFFRIVVASFLGCVIGYERQSRDKSAGMRTHAIVCLGSALLMVVSKYCFTDVAQYDGARIAAQIVSGVGFLGAGVIFVKNSTVSGLTTAAGIWTTAGLGMAIGSGAYFIGISVALLVVLIQILLHKMSFMFAEPTRGYVKITTDQYDSVISDIQEEFKHDKIKLLGFKINKTKAEVKIEFTLLFPSGYDKNSFVIHWSRDSRVHAISG